MIVERLARRCGFEAVERNIPEEHRKLLSHIRKQQIRKSRRRDNDDNDQVNKGFWNKMINSLVVRPH